jgi:hypothetical protein
MNAIGLLRESAGMHFAREVGNADDHVIFEVSPPSVSGAPSPTYRLRVEVINEHASAREVSPTLLPAYCPERHINFDGVFCLAWAEVEPLTIANAEAAAVWWMKLLTFLKRQRVAAARRQWPARSEARAHGPEAALQQMIAEKAADRLGPHFRRSLSEGCLTSDRRHAGGEPRLRLMRDGRRLVSVREGARKLMTRRMRCKCDYANRLRLPICACSDHEQALTNLTISLHLLAAAERKFFESYAATGRRCCGTMEGCPLAA